MNKSVTEIPDWYQLKYRIKDTNENWRYGVLDRYSDEAKKAWKKNRYLIIEDAITPATYKINLTEFEVTPIEIDIGKGYEKNEYNKFVEKSHSEAEKISQKVKKGLTGKMIRMGVGDGYAYYIIVNETPRTVKLEWRGFSADRWVDRMLGYGGNFSKKMIKNLVQ